MPIYRVNGKTYNIPDDKVAGFEARYPEASIEYHNEGKTYQIPLSKRDGFLSRYPKATYEAAEPISEPSASPAATAKDDAVPAMPVEEAAAKPKQTVQDRIRMSARVNQMMQGTQRMMEGLNERKNTMREYIDKSQLGFGQTVEGKPTYNPEHHEIEKTYITPVGNRYVDKEIADAESFQFRQSADMSVSGQLRRATQRLADLRAKREASAQRVHEQAVKEYENNKAPLAAVLFADTYSARQMSDKENAALDVAIRNTEELIKDLKEQQDREQGKDVGYWRGFGRVVGDYRTWDFGMSDLRDAMTMLQADELKGENATQGEREAYNEMMGSIYYKEQAEQMYGDNASFWNRAGVMTGYMPPFILDFGITGGGFDGVNFFAKGAGKAATKVIGKEAIKEMTEQGFKAYVKSNGISGLGQYAGNWTIKALGTMGDDLLIRAPMMTNTVQFGKTTADVIDRKLGDVVVNMDGTYDFSNDKTWSDAVWQGEANAIIENYSEMFGTHLDPVVTFGNMSKLANVLGAKRLSNVLAKADAGALSGIMGDTQKLFNKMGVSDYLGEVTEEYYGQLWRTMLNLDDAYQQNADGTRTNLLATGKFHGDIWGGMALSMGLMGAGKYTLTASRYASMKHSVNKADANANELLGKEIWEPLKQRIDLTTNDDIGNVAEGIVNDNSFTDEERAAVLTYMERSMNLRGFNLATLAEKRGGEQNGDVQALNESYLDGYNMGSPQEMTDAKNMLDYQRQKVSGIVDEDMMSLLDSKPMTAIAEIQNNDVWTDEARTVMLDYLNAKQVYDGMLQRVRDDIDGRIEQSNAIVDARVNRTTGMIQPATMKQDDRQVYVISGNLVQYADGSGIDNKASDESIIVRDAESGALEQVAPDAVLNIDEALDPAKERETAANVIRQQYAQEAADKIDGVATFNIGDTYTITGDDAQKQVQIAANEQGIVDNGDGTVNVTDGTNIFPIAKETIQQQVDAANLARIQQYEEQRAIENNAIKQSTQDAYGPQYALNDAVVLTDENGQTVRGSITAEADADGRYEVYTEEPINGKRVNMFTREELDGMLVEYNGEAVGNGAENGNNGAENITEIGNKTVENIPADAQVAEQQSALERIPKDEKGNPVYEQTDSDTAWDAIVEQTGGDETMAQTVADGMLADKEAALKKLERTKVKGGATVAEKIAAEKDRKAAIDAAKQDVDAWKKIADTAVRRKLDAESAKRRDAEQAEAIRRAEEERMRAEREEAERKEREALNGVPDMVNDTPQDARARGYRRMSGHKIDRPIAVEGLQGKDVSVKFSNDAITNGRVAVIEAEQLQPSHIEGQRNPWHFIDEAQPKERNDKASVLSSRKIAENIRPEEITTSVTAYTGAPTVNARGEVIQGNNRSDALRQMWDGYQDQAAKYKQYLMDHAQDFGLNAEDISGMKHPVLVNMLDVDDAEVIKLGQYVAQDTESGGVERIKAKHTINKMGKDMRSFANLLLKSTDDETTFAGLVDKNGVEVLKWMSQKGYISPTQYQSAFDSKGNLTAEAKNDLRDIMYQSIFAGGSTRLEEMFNAIPAKAQKAILATAFRDYDSPSGERMIEEIQNSIRAYYALSQSADFANAKTFKEARLAVEGWKIQYQIDDASGESYLPADNFSNFALLLATMYKGENQSVIQGTFNKLYDLIQGTQEENLFEQPDNTPRTLAQAIKETLNIIYDGQRRSNVLAGNNASSQRGQQGSEGNAATGERVEDGERTADGGGSIEAESSASSKAVHKPQSERKGLEQNHDGGRKADSTGMADNTTRSVEGSNDRGDLRVFEEGLDTSYNEYSEYSERTRRTAESERLVRVAKQHGMFIPAEVVKTLTGKYQKRTGESVVYIDIKGGKVTKVKDPYAKSPMKSGVQPEDAAFEHLVHNLLFPETEYAFEGISEEMGDVRIVLSQNFIQSKGQPTKEQIAEALAARGLFPEDNYSFGNELVSVTDVEGDNVLLGEDGTVYFIDPIIRFKKPLREIIKALGDTEQQAPTISEQIQAAEADVNTSPTEAQKEAGNYKKGHLKIDGFDVSIEQPKGSVRRGTDASGKQWEQTMNNTYGYIRGTEGVDGDHIDVFLSDDPSQGDVFVVDQVNKDGTFDEHKVMYGFADEESARKAYLSNYEEGWTGLGAITQVSKDEFKKWVQSSHRKTKPFAEYSSVKPLGGTQLGEQPTAGYSIETTTYTNKKGKTTPMHLVTFGRELTKDEIRAGKELAKESRGWWDREKGGFMMRSEDAAKELAETLAKGDEGTIADAQPISMTDIKALNNGDSVFAEPKEPKGTQEGSEYRPVWQYSIHVDKDGYTTITRDDVSSGYPIGDARFRYNTDSPEEMLDVLRNPLNGMQEALEAVGVTLENKIKTRKLERKNKEERQRKYDLLRANGYNGYKIGDEVVYKGKKAKIHDLEEFGEHKPVLDTGLAPVMYVVAEWSDIKPINGEKEYHGGDRVFSLKHNANKDVYMAHHADGKVYYQFTDGTEANADEVEDALLMEASIPANGDVILEKPETWVGKTFFTNGMQLKCTDVSNGYATFDNLTTFMGMGFDVPTVQKYMRSGEWAVLSESKGDVNNEKPKKQSESKTRQPQKNKQEEKKPSSNRLVTDERYAELKEKMRKKLLGQMNIGIDPEILAIGTEMAVYHLEKGARKFGEYATAMIADLGNAIRPYLKAFYNGARNLPEVESSEIAADMTPYDEVQTFDVANFDKAEISSISTAETVAKETQVAKEVEVAQERIKKTRSLKRETKKNSVTSQEQAGGLFDEEEAEARRTNSEINRKFAMAVKSDMLAALDNGTKPYRSILDLRKRASELGMEVDSDGRTDILLQELVEDGLVRAAREVLMHKGSTSRESYDMICKLYDMQPTIAARSSNRIKMQQYSTPLPMAWIANRFAMANNEGGSVLEPTAGNGMLVFTLPVEQVHANELDETRLENLREQGFSKVTQQDATEPFDGGKQYDAIIANPPFGKREAVEYDGKKIAGLDPQITLNALASMKDDGRAAIIIGGNMEYASNGAIKSMKPFFTYLYDHYNVKGVIDMSGGLYAKQGTTFPTRMILIDGRRSDEERTQTAVYPPVESKAIRKAESFDDLYEIINEVLNSNEKTNGTEILRSRERQLASVNNETYGNTDGARHREQPRKNDDVGSRRKPTKEHSDGSEQVLPRERRTNNADGETRAETPRDNAGGSRSVSDTDIQRVGTERVSTNGVGLKQAPTEHKKRTLTDEKSAYRPHNSAFSLNSVAPAAMVEAMDNVLTQIEAQHGSIDEFIRTELGYDTVEEAHQALAAEQMDSVAMAIYQMKQGQALIIGDQTGVGKGRQMAALIRWAVQRGEKPVFITQKADLFSDIYRDLVDVGSGDLVPFIFNSDGAMVDSKGNTVHKPLSSAEMAKVFASGALPDEYDFAVLTYSQVNTGDAVSQQEMEEVAKKSGARTKKSKNVKNGKATPKATFLRAIAENNYLFLDESHTAAGSSNTGAYLQSILRTAKAATFASATFAKRPDTMPLYAIRTAMSQAKVEPDKMISIIEKGGVTLQEIMSRELTNAGQMVRRERDMSDVVTDWKTITDPETVRRARENYDRTIAAFNAIIKFQEDYVKPMIEALDMELAVMAESAGVKRGTDKMGVENVPFASKTYNYTKQLMLALKVDAIADEVEAEINAGRHPVIALESTMESSIKDYAAGEIIDEPTFSASLLKGLDTVMQYTVKDEDGNERHERYSPKELGPAGEKAYYELQDFIRESTSDIFISPLDAIIERLHEKGYKVGELTGRNMYVERNDEGRVVVKRRTDKDKKRMQREFNSGVLDVLILNKSASTGISLHASEKFSDQRQRSMIIAQPLSDINDYMQMIGRIDRTGQVHRGYYINLGLPVPAENRFLMMLSTKLKSLNANTTTSQDSESNDVEAPDLLNKYGSQVVIEYLRDNVEIYEKMGLPLKKNGPGGGRVQSGELDEYKAQEDDARKITGYVALLTTKEQEEFYDDVVRRYNELIKYLNDTGSNDLKITVMPLRAKTIEKRVSSEGVDPYGSNPFARNSYVEMVEMDVLRKPMKADEIRKVIEQLNKGMQPAEYLNGVEDIVRKENESRIVAEEERYKKAKAKAAEDIKKQSEKINGQKKRSDDEKREAIANYIAETNEKVDAKHNSNLNRLNVNSDQLLKRLRMFETGKSYLVPDNLEALVFDFAAPATFCGYKAKDSKITLSTTLAVFATLDGRRRVEIKLSQIGALDSINRMTNDNWDAARENTLENWDSQIPTETRKNGYIMTGNILQAIADTQDEHGGYPGQLISYTDIDGNVHDGILMPDKWNSSMLKTSGAPLSGRLQQIKEYKPVMSHDGKVEIMGSKWAKTFYLTVPRTKKDGAVYFENKTLLKAAGGIFYPYRGKLRADIPEERIAEVVKELTKLGVKVKEENAEDMLYRSDDTLYRIRDDAPPTKTGIGYKVFVLKDGKLYPPMVANPGGEATPVGVWLDADAAPIAGQSKTGRTQVKAGGKGTQGGSGKLAYRPGWHLGEIPYALQFNRKDENGERTLFPSNFVWAEVEYANDVDYQEEAMSYGYNQNGKFQHSYAGLPRVPENGAYKYRTNPNPETDPWIITGAMRVKRLLTPTEVDKMVKAAGREPQRRQDGAVTDEQINALNAEIANDYREGYGAYSDDEISYENDPWSKAMGKSIRTRKQRMEYAALERKRMKERVESLAKELHLDNVEIVTDASQLEGKKQRAKGFYSKSTGKITIVIPNHISAFDVEQTLLHEAVAHYGLRKLFGEHFDTFLDNVFNNADDAIRRTIVELASKNGWDFRTATEEYLAGLAEDINYDTAQRTGWWQKIKDFFIEMLHKIGFEDFSGVTLSDNELRYILWRSYWNLAEPGWHRNILLEAGDTAKQYELKVGNFAVSDNSISTVASNNDELYRDGDPEIHERAMARDRYERRVKSGMFQTQEAIQDSMLGLKEAMQAILGKERYIEDVDGFENAYLGENRLSSVNKAEADAFARLLFKPMLDEVAKLSRNEAERNALTDYMMAKHGLERNEYMRNQAEASDEETERDFAGLTALTGMDNVADAEAEARQMVLDYEDEHDTTNLWEKINAVSKAILQKSYECGMMSKETYDKVSDMYEFYIPLRGFDETTSAEAYAYLTHRNSAFNAPIKKAEGRISKADDPFANLESMAESAIMQGNRNKLVKQRFLNFALNHPSDLVSVSDLWLKYDETIDEWQPVFPDNIESTDTPEEVEQKMQEFNAKMEQLSENDATHYKKGKDAVGIPYRVVESRDMRQHQVVVRRNGRDYVITINGNPRAAQALNGQTNPDNDMSGAIGALLRAGEKINRQLSAFYTTRNPDFIVSNFMRDMLYTNTITWIKESPNYALRFHRNYLMVNPVTMKRLLAKYRKGTLDMSNKTEAMFHQFMMNGGETGYANIRDIEQHKNDIRKELKRANGKLKLARAWSLLAEKFDELNRAVENCARFAAFVTSREMGRSIDRAIYDAKEISVNFNKKGSGAKFYDSVNQTRAGNASAFVSGLGRSGFVFWNAAIQGTTNFGRQAKRHPAKAFTGVAALFLLGAIVAYLGGDDDDDDKNAYYNLPEYVRRSNILFRAGDSWISIPLPIEYRAFYGMGELMTSVLNGKEHLTEGEIAEAITSQATQLLPIDFMEGGGGINAFVPSAVKPLWEAYVAEKSWTGMPLYKDTPYNKDMPEWTKAYKNSNKYIVGLAAALNEATGGDPYTKGSIDFNPAKVEYLLNGYFGGVFGTIDKMTKSAETIVGAREYDPRSILIANRLIKAGDERTEYRAVNNEYFRLKEEHDRLKTRLKHYEEDTGNGVFDYAEKIDFLYNSPEYERYEIFEDYRKDIDALYDELKETVDDKERKDIEAELNELKKEMIGEMNLTRKRK